jgi:hypothetical protein
LAIQIPELLTVKEVAKLLKTSADTVVRRFEHYKGVFDIGQRETRYNRGYRQLRIPDSVLSRWLSEKIRWTHEQAVSAKYAQIRADKITAAKVRPSRTIEVDVSKQQGPKP